MPLNPSVVTFGTFGSPSNKFILPFSFRLTKNSSIFLDEFHDFIEESRNEDIVTESTVTRTETKVKIDTQIKKIRHELRHSFSTHYVVEKYTFRVYYWWWAYSYTYTRRYPVTTRTSYTVPITTYDTNTQNQASTTTKITPGPVTNTTTKTNKHMVVSTMRLERYYSSVREEVSSLMIDAVALLDAQDYIGFFKACGPNYVRGIRRAQEVTGIFTFESENVQKAKTFATTLRSKQTKLEPIHKTSNKSLEIQIIGYGLGLNVVGAGNLLATNLEEYYEAMKFAFRSMTQSKDSYHIGQVYGIEVVPWVDNTSFQVAARLLDEVIETPLPRSLIPKAISISSPAVDFNNSEANRLQFRCKDFSHQIDKYGQCCEENSLYNHTTSTYDNFPPISTKVCRPVRTLDPSMIRNNLIGNAEFVARLDRTLRYKMNQLATMQQCISAARAIPNRNNYNILKAFDKVHDMHVETPDFSVLELKLALDPFNDYGMVRHMTKEIDEYLEMFYSPCMAALFGTNRGSNTNTDPSFLLAYPWHTHKECLHMSCFARGMRWDRESGGCVPGLIAGAQDAALYNTSDSFCAKDADYYDKDSIIEKCKHNTTELNTFYGKAKTCWDGAVPAGRIDHYLDNYCMPNIIPEKINPAHQISLSLAQAQDCEQQQWPANTKTNPFRIIKKDTKQQLFVGGAVCLPDSGIVLQSSTNSAAGYFVYDLSDQTLSPINCDQVLTPTCDTTEIIMLKTKNASPQTEFQRWKMNNDGSIENMDCKLAGGETTYLTVLAGATMNAGLGDTAATTEADFELSWLNDPYP